LHKKFMLTEPVKSLPGPGSNYKFAPLGKRSFRVSVDGNMT